MCKLKFTCAVYVSSFLLALNCLCKLVTLQLCVVKCYTCAFWERLAIRDIYNVIVHPINENIKLLIVSLNYLKQQRSFHRLRLVQYTALWNPTKNSCVTLRDIWAAGSCDAHDVMAATDGCADGTAAAEYVHQLSKRLIVGWEAKLSQPHARIYYVK